MKIEKSNFANSYGISENGILLSANRTENINGSKDQLDITLKFILYHSRSLDSGHGIIELHDHKGQLHILWSNEKSYERLHKLSEEIWNMLCGAHNLHFIQNCNDCIRDSSNV